MSLTLGRGPLAAHPSRSVNYTVDGPAHALFMQEFPRRVRAVLAGRTVFDTRRGQLLHETGLLPQLYVPVEDVATELLRPTELSTHCPFKGDASYWTIQVGDTVAADAVWAYQDPNPDADWLRGLQAFYWDRLDEWWDEDEQVFGHLRDPYHRVDVRSSGVRVRVRYGRKVIARTTGAKVLSETGLPNRYYFPVADVTAELVPGAKRTQCPYKGQAHYWSVVVDGETLTDAAWSVPEPLDGARPIADHLGFEHQDLTVEVEPA